MPSGTKEVTYADVEALQKALECGGGSPLSYDPVAGKLLETLSRLNLGKLPLQYGALQVEDIDMSKMIWTTFSLDKLKLWKNIGKKKK